MTQRHDQTPRNITNLPQEAKIPLQNTNVNNLEKGSSSENNTPIKAISAPRNLVDMQ